VEDKISTFLPINPVGNTLLNTITLVVSKIPQLGVIIFILYKKA
jgi:hypothetical protein